MDAQLGAKINIGVYNSCFIGEGRERCKVPLVETLKDQAALGTGVLGGLDEVGDWVIN